MKMGIMSPLLKRCKANLWKWPGGTIYTVEPLKRARKGTENIPFMSSCPLYTGKIYMHGLLENEAALYRQWFVI
jgi:hypothetical protein